jgi:hypothetical protein
MSANLEQLDSITTSAEGGERAPTKYVVDTNLDLVKEIDEDVQYQIAQAQSPLSANSKESWQLCKRVTLRDYYLFKLHSYLSLIQNLLCSLRCHPARGFPERHVQWFRWQPSRVYQCRTSVSELFRPEVGWVCDGLGLHSLQCGLDHRVRLWRSDHGLLWASKGHAVGLSVHLGWGSSCCWSADPAAVQGLAILARFWGHFTDSFGSCLCD